MRCFRFLMAWVALITFPALHAQPTAPLLVQAQRYVAQQWDDPALPQHAAPGLERTITVMSPRGAALQPCPSGWQWEPLDLRHWGRIHVGLKCQNQAGSLVAVVHVQAPVWVAAQALPKGHRLQLQDMQQRVQPVERADDLNQDLHWLDRTLRKALAAGDAVRGQHLLRPVYARKGEKLEIRASVDGVTVSATGVAARTAYEGETLRVRNLSSQQWVTGRLIAPGVLEPARQASGGVKVQVQSND